MTVKDLKNIINNIDDTAEIKIWANCDESDDTEFGSELWRGYMYVCHGKKYKTLILTDF